MSENNCTHDCSSCGEECASRTNPQDLHEPLNKLSSVNKVIAVVSGKGGVGKSLVTSLLAVAMNRRDKQTAIMDADVTGPSIPKIFGLKDKALGNELGIIPVLSATGIDVMSVNLLLEDIEAPVVWRGPVLSGIIKQFWSDTIWKDIEYMFVDMPPGTGDVPLTVFQCIPLDGIVIVTSPQELASLIVTKAVNMAKMMNIPIIGIIENMSYAKCPGCGKEIKVFGESHVDEVAKKFGIPVLAKLPINPDIAVNCDRGLVELVECPEIEGAVDAVEAL